jgi:hypothetical protein
LSKLISCLKKERRRREKIGMLGRRGEEVMRGTMKLSLADGWGGDLCLYCTDVQGCREVPV